MNIQVSAKTFTSEAALLAYHAEVRRRLFNPPAAARIVVPSAPADEIVTVRRRLPRQKLHFHDSHVFAYRRWQMVSANGPCTSYILMRCGQEGIPYEVVTGPTRKRKVALFRQMLVWEIKTKVKPEITYPELGRLFGGRDHTTVLWAVKAHAKRIGA